MCGLSPLSGNLNIDFFFLFKEHKLHLKKKNLPNSNYEEHILTTCIIQRIMNTLTWEGRSDCIMISTTGCGDLANSVLGLTLSRHQGVVVGYLREANGMKIQCRTETFLLPAVTNKFPASLARAMLMMECALTCPVLSIDVSAIWFINKVIEEGSLVDR